ncbi:MAG TPA: bifunctional DNA primase/polymerase [Polyangiaceae bacterium]
MASPVQSPSALLESALSLIARGWPVFPCHTPIGNGCSCRKPKCNGTNRGKHPRLEHGFLEASTQPNAIHAWWMQWPDANIAIRTGSGLLVLDIDRRNAGDETMAALEREHGELPHSYRVITGNGWHVYLRVPEDIKLRGTLGEGIDAKHDGGYVMAPPSLHLSGVRYAHDVGSDDGPAEAPKWVLDILQREGGDERPAIPGTTARETLLGEAFHLAGMLGRHIGEGKWSVCCPWLVEHTPDAQGGRTGDGKDSSTVLFPPTTVARVGGFCCRHGHCSGRGLQDVLRMLPADAVDAAQKMYPRIARVPPPVDDTTPHPDDAAEKPEVRLTSNSAKNVDRLDAALAEAARDVFQRSLQLVEVVEEKRPGLITTGAPVLRPLNKYSLELHVSRHLRCVRWEPPPAITVKQAEKNGTQAPEGRWVSTRASSETAIMPMLAYGRWREIRPISGLTESPIFRPDGTIMQEAGYDPATGYLFRPSIEYPRVPDQPTQDDAKAALAKLQHVFCDFPYVSRAARVVPIAALLTILARSAIDGNVPVFAFEASIQGAGKTLQGDLVHIIATGRMPPHSSFPHDEDEQRKTILSCALSASPVAFFDNVKGVFGGEALEAAVTSGEIKQRILGASVDSVVPWLATIIVTGNNMTMTEDMLRRSLLCRIEPDVEDPTKRKTFAHPNEEDPRDLPTWVKDERADLIVAALTILRAYALKQYPDAQTGMMQSFNAWSRIVPGAIAFAGGANVLEAIGTDEKGGSDESAAVAMLIRELKRLSNGAPMSTKAILSALYPAPHKDSPPDGWDAMREAIEALTPMHGPVPNTLKFAHALRSRLGQVSSGHRLACKMDRLKSRLWFVEAVKVGNPDQSVAQPTSETESA